MNLRIISWNMNYSFRRGETNVRTAWSYLDSIQPDIALLQETNPPEERRHNILWQPIGGTRDWGSAIVPYGGIELVPIPSARLGGPRKQEELEDSHPGCLRVADAHLPGGSSVTVISIYGLFDSNDYATTTAHRMLSDLMPILDVANYGPRHVVLGGDLNISPQVPEPDRPHHIVVINRILAFGLIDCLRAKNHDYVRTTRHKNRADSTPYQNDWIFSTPELQLLKCYALDDETAWSLSDHCPVIAEFAIAESP